MDALANRSPLVNDLGGPSVLGTWAPKVARHVLGLGALVAGLDAFVAIVPRASDAATVAPAGSGACLHLAAILVGALLLLNRYVPLALAVAAPLLAMLVASAGAVALQGVGPALLLVALEAFLLWSYRASFAPMLVRRAWPVDV